MQDDEWTMWSNNEVAKQCGVSHQFVNNLRNEMSLATVASERTYTTKHGTTATMQNGP